MAGHHATELHVPTALPYLVAEGILSPNPSPTSYRWDTYDDETTQRTRQEELVITEYCVAYSSGNTIRKVFRFEIEEQKVQEAVLTWFPSESYPGVRNDKDKRYQSEANDSPVHAANVQKVVALPPTSSLSFRRKPGYGTLAEGPTSGAGRSNSDKSPDQPQRDRALVVFLKSQAHVFFIHGSTHVINLPFEVGRVFAAPNGVVIQRRVAVSDLNVSTPLLPSAPQNSFLSPEALRIRQRAQTSSHGQHKKPAERGNRASRASFALEDLLQSMAVTTTDDLPRHYSLSDPFSEMGLVAVSAKQSLTGRESQALQLQNAEALPSGEEVLYVSPNDEIFNDRSVRGAPLIFLVTASHSRKVYIIYRATYVETKPLSANTRKASGTFSGSRTRRRSSFAPGTGATTPVVRPRDQVRESIGAAPISTQESGSYKTAEETFASQLDPDFDRKQQPAKESRRVSSLISRIDISTNHDRSTFQDLATNHAGPTSAYTSRRAPSLGMATSRSSLVGRRSYARASTPGSMISRTSMGNSSDGEPDLDLRSSRLSTAAVDESIETGPAGFATVPFRESLDGLRKELILQKLVDIPMDKPGGFSAWTQSEHLHKPRVFSVREPMTAKSARRDSQRVSIHLVQSHIRDHIEVMFDVRKAPMPAGSARDYFNFVPTYLRHIRHDDQLDAIKVVDRNISRIVSLHHQPSSHPVVRLWPSWTTDTTLTTIGLPHLTVNASQTSSELNPESFSTTAQSFETSNDQRRFISLACPGLDSSFDIRDSDGRYHRVRLCLSPVDSFVRTVLDVCRLVLPESVGDALTTCWWLLTTEFQGFTQSSSEEQWLALITSILSLAVGRVPPPAASRRDVARSSRATSRSVRTKSMESSKADTDEKRKRNLQESASNDIQGTLIDASEFSDHPVWSRVTQRFHQRMLQGRPVKLERSTVITSCIYKARKFIASEAGSSLLSPFYDRGDSGKHDLPRLLLALHILREEQKLNVLNKGLLHGGPRDIGPVISQLGYWLGWNGWDGKNGGYYAMDGTGEAAFEFERAIIQGYPNTSPPPFAEPPSIISWISNHITKSPPSAYDRVLTLIHLVAGLTDPNADAKAPHALQKLVDSVTPRMISIVRFFRSRQGKTGPTSSVIELMEDSGISRLMLDTLPQSVAAVLSDARIQCQANPPTIWKPSTLRLVGRDDLQRLTDINGNATDGLPSMPTVTHAHHDLHTICQTADKQAGAAFSPELERHRIAQLIFHEDRRYWEAEKLLNTLRTSVAECVPDAAWSDTEVLEAQKAIVQCVMVRTFSLAAGQSMFHYDSKKPLVTQTFRIHGYSMSCLIKPMNITLSAERVQFTEEKYGWAWFHAGVAAGLGISKQAKGIDTSWIVFNKPAELTNRHAGLLLGLGLNGHLRHIAKWLSFKYLTPKHTMTSIGLLLGLSVSFLGSMDTLVTRLLSVHITRMLPPGAAELNLSPLTQTTGLMGIGMLYYATQHRRMSEIMLSELEFPGSDNALEVPESVHDENYRLAAGFSLGFINLGKGNDLRGLHDMRVVERLLAVAVGSRQVDLVHVLDQATAGAVIAIALIFMKTEIKSVAQKIEAPDTLQQFDYVRPDILLLRTMARHIIMWADIRPTDAWIRQNLPTEFSSLRLITEIRSLKSEHLAFYNILAGLLWSVALKHAGTGSSEIRDFLIYYLDHFIRIALLPAYRYDAKLARNTVRNCQDLVALSCAVVMAGTGDLIVFRRLRRLHGRVTADVTYGSHMAAHMALGMLFLGGGSYTLGTSNLAIASLILSLYPLYPVDVTDNRSHLQAFRHFWVLAAEARCLVVRDMDTKKAIAMPFTIALRDGKGPDLQQAPTLLPPFSQISKLTTQSVDYWPVTLDFDANPAHLPAFRHSQTVFVRRRPATSYDTSVFSATLTALNDAQSASASRVMWNWVFALPAFADFEPSLRSLVLPPPSASAMASGAAGAGTLDVGYGVGGSAVPETGLTVLDARLQLTRTATRSFKANELSDLKALFAWADDQARNSNGRLAWLGMAVIDQLKLLIERRSRGVA